MKRLFLAFFSIMVISFFSFHAQTEENEYSSCYSGALKNLNESQVALLNEIESTDLTSETEVAHSRSLIAQARLRLKSADFWLRYLEPIAYKKINGPLPVEWETEVFEKFEKPYKREGAGLTLAELALEEDSVDRDRLLQLIRSSIDAIKTFQADSITSQLTTPDHFFLANRLFLLNLAAIYTTGFECPNTENIIPELKHMLPEVKHIYQCFNHSFPATPLPKKYLDLYDRTIAFTQGQPDDFTQFDHFTFVKDYVNPLYVLNQGLINSYHVISKSFNDYSLNNSSTSIFDKSFCRIQNTKGIFSMVEDEETLADISQVGKLLFYDPILSGNNTRSCASCHNPKQFFTDTTARTALQFDRQHRLTRNTPTLVDVIYNHLLMLDGKHTSLQAQARGVITNPKELRNTEEALVEKVLSCKEYKKAFKKWVKLTPEEEDVTMDHIVSAITLYYGRFSRFYAPFDEAMNENRQLDERSKKGFNLFMSKAQCGTCHFVPFFNGVKPPYISSEFEVLGTPEDTGFTRLSADSGRYDVHPAAEMFHAFRTVTLRNILHTAPYMHNGIFKTIDQVIDFYDAGGGQGRKLDVPNQTLSPDSLHLTAEEKENLIAFLRSLNEKVVFDDPPAALPASSDDALNARKPVGEY